MSSIPGSAASIFRLENNTPGTIARETHPLAGRPATPEESWLRAVKAAKKPTHSPSGLLYRGCSRCRRSCRCVPACRRGTPRSVTGSWETAGVVPYFSTSVRSSDSWRPLSSALPEKYAHTLFSMEAGLSTMAPGEMWWRPRTPLLKSISAGISLLGAASQIRAAAPALLEQRLHRLAHAFVLEHDGSPGGARDHRVQ
jgi:hypothetical protein